MNNLVVPTLVLFATTAAVEASTWEVRKIQDDRALSSSPGAFDFLISNASPPDEPLCITATEGMKDFGNLKLLPCDFAYFPPEQLWNYENGKLFNDLGNGQTNCMVINHGETLFDGVRIRLADCNEALSFNEFIFDGDLIRVTSDDGYCITNRGATAQIGDSIHVKPCRDRDDFKWLHTEEDSRNDGGTLYSFYAEGGCIQPKDGSTAKFTEIIMDECNAASVWNIKEVNGVQSFRSNLDITKCLQAGLGGVVTHGTKLRLMPCKGEERLQHFEWSDETPIRLANRDEFEPDLCLEWRGRNVNVGVDPVIMKTCDLLVWEGWSGDEVY